jgi:hypothetical protein
LREFWNGFRYGNIVYLRQEGKNMINKAMSLYLDTSVIGGYFDKEFERDTRLLFQKIKEGEYGIKNYNSVNIKNGYRSLEIRSPKDMGVL